MNGKHARQTGRVTPKRKARAVALGGGATLAIGGPLVAAAPAGAAGFVVTNLDDAGAGSLRQAIDDANGSGGPDVITFQSGLSGTITLSTGQLEISDSVTIQGPGASIISVSGNDASRVFYLYNSAAEIGVTISGLTITDGAASDGAGIINFDEDLTLDSVVVTNNASTGDGGGLWGDGFAMDLRIINSTFSGNTTTGEGGGIYIEDTPTGAEVDPLLIQGTVISGNTAGGDGGGIYLYDPDSSVVIDTSTISGNTAANRGGGVYLYNLDTLGTSLTISRTTISGNHAAAGGGVFFYDVDRGLNIISSTISGNDAVDGGGVYLYDVTELVRVEHSTISGNTATGDGGGIFVLSGDDSDVVLDHSIMGNNTATNGADIDSPAVVDSAFSLLESTGGVTLNDLGGTITGQDPALGPLAANGGPTQTHLPQPGSPVINTGDPAFAPPPDIDQRGLARVAEGRIDIGAVETAPVDEGCLAGATQNQKFVCEVYLDVLHREVDGAGATHWSAQLGSGALTRSQVAGGILGSSEYRTLVLDGMYHDFLGRGPDAAGLTFFLNALQAGATLEVIQGSILSSPEYFTANGGTNNAWLAAVYQDLLGRDIDSAGANFFNGQLASGASRATVAQSIAVSQEARTLFVQSVYADFLDRAPDPAGASWALGVLNSGFRREHLVAIVVGSPEYLGLADGEPDS